ncbi:MAG: flagellar hook-associated protein FlgK, partial [bacterium]
ASSLGIQVAGNNMAHAATPGSSRQSATLTPSRDARFGNGFVGRGVEMQAIRRQVDSALQNRLVGSIAAEQQSQVDLSLLSNVEGTLNELSEQDLSTQLGAFFSSWSDLASQPGNRGARSLVIQQGRGLSTYIRSLREGLADQQAAVDRDLTANTNRANELLSRIADLNAAVVTAENGSGNANGLRDQRDTLIAELAQFMDVTTLEQPNGNLDVLVGSTPIVQAGVSRGVRLKTENIPASAGQPASLRVVVSTSDNNETLAVRSGRLGALLNQRDSLISQTIDRLDTLAAQLIHQVNRIHATGEPGQPTSSFTGSFITRTADVTRAINDPDNLSFLELRVRPTSGSFMVTIRNNATGELQSARIEVDLDGLVNLTTPGFSADTSVDSLRSDLNALANVSAAVTSDGRLNITADTGYSISFSDDTSGVLATLGINSYFDGVDASNIDVRPDLQANPSALVTGRRVPTGATDPWARGAAEGDIVDNGTSLAIAALADRGLSELGGLSLGEHWEETANSIGVRTTSARTSANAATVVRESLDAQRSAVSGVSIDEESISLLNFQRQYQASARLISVVDELTQNLLTLVG